MKKIRIETILSDGSKITISLNGPIDRKKLENFLMLINYIDSPNSQFSNENSQINALSTKSLYDKVKYLVKNYFVNKPFTLSEFLKVFVDFYGYPIKKSTLSTYLARLINDGILLREGYRGKYVYRYVGSIVKIEKS